MIRSIVGWSLLLTLTLTLSVGCGRSVRQRESRPVFGTVVEVTAVGQPAAVEQGLVDVWRVMARVDELMSVYREDSELSRINRLSAMTWVSVSDDTWAVLQQARALGVDTQGAFDITVGPLVEAWGLYDEYTQRPPPDTEMIQQAQALVGWEQLLWDDNAQQIALARTGMQLDVGAIAKGYAVDQALLALRSAGCVGGLVNAGGDLAVFGLRHDGTPWQIGVRHPRQANSMLGVLPMTEGAVATSGDYERYREWDGQRYTHILDPRSGRPAQSDVLGVTVRAQDCMTADGWATALFVLGPEVGLRLLERSPDVQAIMVLNGEGAMRLAGTQALLDSIQWDEDVSPIDRVTVFGNNVN